MNNEKMTVHRALAELKNIDSRIYKLISQFVPCISNKHSNTKINGIPINEFTDKMKSDYKSIRTLINRRNAIKKAVSLSNAVTEIEVDGIKYRVAEAIEMKNHGMDNYNHLLKHITSRMAECISIIDKNNSTLDKRADDYIIGLYGSRDKVTGEDAQSTRKAYIDANIYEMIDPIDVNKITDELRSKSDNFMAEIDAALSVSNAITEIEFSYEVL